MQAGSRGQDRTPVEGSGRPAEIGDHGAGFGGYQRSRRHVPGLQLHLPITVQYSGGDVAEIDSGAAATPHAVAFTQQEGFDQGAIQRNDFIADIGESGSQQGAFELDGLAALQVPAATPQRSFQPGSAAADGEEELIQLGRVDHSDTHSLGVAAADRDGEERMAVNVVGRTVERIDHPVAAGRRLVTGSLLGQEAVSGKRAQQIGADPFLDGPIEIGDHIGGRLIVDASEPSLFAQQDFARRQSYIPGRIAILAITHLHQSFRGRRPLSRRNRIIERRTHADNPGLERFLTDPRQ